MKQIALKLNVTSTYTLLVFVAITCIAAGLRLYRIEVIDYRYDAATTVQYALDIINGHPIAVVPYSGSVASHPPLYVYLLAIPLFFTRDLMAVMVFRVLLDVAAIAALGFLCLQFSNSRVAVFSMLFFAIAPAAVFSARTTAIELLPILTLVLLYGLFVVWIRHDPRGWTWIGVGLAICLATHLSGVYFIPVVVITAIFRIRTLNVISVIRGLAPLFALAAIYLLNDAANGFTNMKGLSSLTSEIAITNLDAMKLALTTSGGAHMSDLTGQAVRQWYDLIPKWLDSLNDIQQISLVVIGGIIVSKTLFHVLRSRQNKRGEKMPDAILFGAVTLLFWLLPIAFQTRHSRPIVTHYLTILFPTPFMLMAIGLDIVYSWIKPLKTRPGVFQKTAYYGILLSLSGALVTIGAWQIITTCTLTDFVGRVDTPGGYGLPLQSALTAAQRAKMAATEGISNQVVVVIEDYLTPWHEQGIILNTLLMDIPHRFINSKVDGWIFRQEGTSYIFAPGTESLLTHMLDYFDHDQVQVNFTPIRSSGGSGYTYVQISGLPQLTGARQARPAIWDSGVDLISYRNTIADTAITMETMMKVTQAQPEGANYHWYNHVFTGSTKLAGIDSSGIHPSSWRPGDYLLQKFIIPIQTKLPDNPLYIRYGSYDFPKVQTVMVSEDGKQPENGVNLALPFPLISGP